MKQEKIEINVYGKVHGVWFRKYTEIEAKRLSLKGYVENKTDGSVHIIAEGASNNIETLLKWCVIGSPESDVTNVTHHFIDSKDNFTDFTIRR